MLGDHTAAATLAVRDLERARGFYETTLGLEPVREDAGAVMYRSGASVLLVYPSEYAGTNQATAASWAVGGELDAIVGDLAAKGVAFEHYDDLPGVTREGDVHLMGDVRGVWLRDPDGNILSLTDMAV